MQDAIRRRCGVLRMSHQNTDGAGLTDALGKQRQHPRAAGRVQVAGRFVGLAGVAASFAALAAARRREFGMLRHLGLTRRQIGWMLAQEGALAAGLGVLGGLLAGSAIGLVLIEVVNRQSFHWSMDVHVPWGSLTLFAAGLIALAALAAVLAGRQAMRQDAVLAVREDW